MKSLRLIELSNRKHSLMIYNSNSILYSTKLKAADTLKVPLNELCLSYNKFGNKLLNNN